MQFLPGTHDLLFITFDTMRYDVAQRGIAEGCTPFLSSLLPNGWERRHTPGTFTFAAHQAFFAGFLPTPAVPSKSKPPRLFAARFPESESTKVSTVVFDTPDIVTGLAGMGYHTMCIGGVGFFNPSFPLGSVLPGLFMESHWTREMGVYGRYSTELQVKLACERLAILPYDQRAFVFINISALHEPNHIFAEGATEDTPDTQLAALAYVDTQLAPLFATMRKRAPLFAILCADHGAAYGEDGYTGHRLAHSVVWDVPYAEMILEKEHS
jgi:hypothetical protein